MPLISVQAPPPTTTPLSSDLQHDLAKHANSVLENGIRQLKLRPTLERCHSESTISYCSSISPPPDLEFPEEVPRGSVVDGTSARDDSRSTDLTEPTRIDSPFFDLTQPNQISIMTKNGIFNLYVSHAQGHIERHQNSGEVSKISRARVELELLNAIAKGDLPIEYKMCWTKAILTSSNFESFWLDKSRRLKLPRSCMERYNPSDDFLEYETPTPSASETDSPRPTNSDHEAASDSDYVHVQGTQLPTPSAEDEADGDDEYITPEAAAFAQSLGGEHTSVATAAEEVPSFDPRGIIGVDTNGLARETGDDGAWGNPKRNSKSKKPRRASTSTPAKPRTPKSSTASKDEKPAKPKASKAKRDFAAIADEIGPHGTPYKKVKRNSKSAGNGTSSAGRQRKKTEKAKAIEPGQI